MWGIKVKYDDRGLECCGWMEASGGPGEAEFDSKVEAQAFIDALPPIPEEIAYDRILTPQKMGG